MKKDTNRKIMNPLHFALLEEVKVRPRLESELLWRFGPEYEETIADLKTNGYPISGDSLSLNGSSSRIFFFDNERESHPRCEVCGTQTASSGTFCSEECKRDFALKVSEEIRQESKEIQIRRHKTFPVRLVNVIHLQTIAHLAKRAKFSGKFTVDDCNAVIRNVSSASRKGRLPEMSRAFLDEFLWRAVDSGFASSPCSDTECRRCRDLHETLRWCGLLKEDR